VSSVSKTIAKLAGRSKNVSALQAAITAISSRWYCIDPAQRSAPQRVGRSLVLRGKDAGGSVHEECAGIFRAPVFPLLVECRRMAGVVVPIGHFVLMRGFYVLRRQPYRPLALNKAPVMLTVLMVRAQLSLDYGPIVWPRKGRRRRRCTASQASHPRQLSQNQC